jgi:hypothetical protein
MPSFRPLLTYAAPHRAALALGAGLMLLESAAALFVVPQLFILEKFAP